jgi:hypothetical protein
MRKPKPSSLAGETRNKMLALGITVLVSMVAHAADPKTRRDPNTPTEREQAKTQTTALPSHEPEPTAVRRPASFTRQTPLSEAIGILRNSTTPPLKIIVLWRPLNSAGVYADTPIGLDGVAGLRAGQILDLLVLSLSAGASAKIGYVADKGVMTISTADALPIPKPVVRLYDVSDLVAPPARYALPSRGFGTGYGGRTPPLGGYPGNLGAGFSNPANGPAGSTGPIARTYHSR